MLYIFKLNDYITRSEFVELISICRHMWSNTMLYRESILMAHIKLTVIPMKLGTIQFIEAEAFISTSFETHQCWVSIANSIFNRQIEGLNHANAIDCSIKSDGYTLADILIIPCQKRQQKFNIQQLKWIWHPNLKCSNKICITAHQCTFIILNTCTSAQCWNNYYYTFIYKLTCVTSFPIVYDYKKQTK